MLQNTAHPEYTAEFVHMFADTLREADVHRALQLLNQTTPYRFTGVYCFEPNWVRSLVLFDRHNPDLQVGADMPMKESYCMFTARADAPLIIENAPKDARWIGHAARDSVLSYVAVLLLDPAGLALGTLCHFDFCSRVLPQGVLERLASVREVVQEHLWALGVRSHQDTAFS